MKRVNQLLIFLLLMCVSCTKTAEFSLPESDPATRLSDNSTRGSDSFYVNAEDISNYITFKRLLSKDTSFVVKSSEEFPSKDNPCAYIINYEDCWEMISTDKRTPAVLAKGPGSFIKDEVNPAAMSWMEDLANAVSSLSDNTEITKEQSVNYMFWQLITSDDRLLNEETRIVLPFPPPFGYHLVSIDSTMEYYDEMPHLITTHWGQESPYNQYCPLIPNSTTVHALAGCVAVAGAQMLNYLHCFLDAPELAPDTASCSGHAYSNNYDYSYYQYYGIPAPYQMSQWNFNELSWSRIASGDSSVIAVLIANVGKEAGLIYTEEDGSAGSISKLPDFVFAPIYNINSFYDSLYNENTVLDLLEDGYPTIVRASSSSLGGIHTGHAFIIDRYSRSQIKYIFTYEENNPEPGQQPVTTKRYTYSAPFISHFGMNWGWAGLDDDMLFVLAGPWCPANYSYQANKAMVVFH